ncbi:uncharacterized protein LOC112088924 [Eutrema salsugineum]|uniref:uncharacterized protein LOC112088924 n=1 Tax=Eutrema salsugineum TaxID=72664 RepID=UPI000CED44EB|nr:uncharacterized protein LOC112088924 [Eutrema salsugineum]
MADLTASETRNGDNDSTPENPNRTDPNNTETPANSGQFDQNAILQAITAQFQEITKHNNERLDVMVSQIAELSQTQTPLRGRNLIGDLNSEEPPTGTVRSTALGSTGNPATQSTFNRDEEFEAMKVKLREITSQIHKATSAAPEIDRVIQEAQKTPFTPRIANTPVRHLEKLKLKTYEGDSDPKHFLTSFGIVMNRFQFRTTEEKDPVRCQFFVENLLGVALDWFTRLQVNSINSFAELSTASVKHFSMFIGQKTRNAKLWRMVQGENESLRDFIKRFKSVVVHCTVSDEATLECLHKATRIKSSFHKAIKHNPPLTLEDALHRSNSYIAEEEEEAAYDQSKSSQKQVDPKERPKNDNNESRPTYDRGFDNRRKFTSNNVNSAQPQRPWNNKWICGNDDQDETLFCEFHNRKGHSTEECRHLKDYLLEQFRKDPRHRWYNQTDNPQPARPEQQKQGRENNDTDTHVPKPRKRVNFIMGKLEMCNYSVRGIKEYSRQAITASKLSATTTSGPAIAFTEADTIGLQMPHNDSLVVDLLFDDVEVSRVLIDTGSLVNVIFRDTLEQMDFPKEKSKADIEPLTGFTGEQTMTVGTVKIPIYVAGVAKTVKFFVMKTPAIYNAILGTPWLHAMKAVASTYHQCVKFPTSGGIYTLRGNQATARSCYINECKLRIANQSCAIRAKSDPITQKQKPPQETVVQVSIDETFPERQVGIGADLDPEIREDILQFLCKHVTTFAWSISDMPGIDPKVARHELNIDPTFKPVKQKRRKLGLEKAQAVNDEVERLLQAGSITEVRYPDWLANPVVVKKKNGKWIICVDFTDLNKACPKDSFPLPHIDRLVEATAGNELLSFMDAFSGYNQILMHPEDREKTSFITDRGIYCYKVMPFGLKNAGATYQRFVNRMFASQLGRTMEVYIDDMLVKSLLAKDHVRHLQTCFEILDQYGMKLNPTNCTFGVTSGEFLGYIVTRRGIEANPKQITAILELPSPTTKREVQKLTGRIAALNRFIFRSTDKCLPFYQILRGNKHLEWNDDCEHAFKQLKEYLSTPPILAKPEDGETLYVYIAVSVSAVSSVLVREDRGEQKPIFYTSKALNDAESRYPTLEKLALAVVTLARKLRPYFQSHSITVLTDQPLRAILHNPSQSGRLAKWAIELSKYDIGYKNRTSAKPQVLADFFIELSPELIKADLTEAEKWVLHVDGSSSYKEYGIGIQLKTPTGKLLEQSFRLDFPASNNEAEYETLIAGLRLAKEIGAQHLHAYCDSQLVASQFSGEYDTKNDRMEAYLQLVKQLAAEFNTFNLTKIPRGENAPADALAALASNSDPHLKRTIPIESISRPSIKTMKDCNVTTRRRDYEAEPNLEPPLRRRRRTLGDTNLPLNFDGRIDETDLVQENEDDAELPSEGRHDPLNVDENDEEVPPDWTQEIIAYLANEELPPDKWEAHRLKMRAARYMMIKDGLFRWSAAGILLICVSGKEIKEIMKKVHEGSGGNHSGGRSLALKIKKASYFWPTMVSVAKNLSLSVRGTKGMAQ